MQPERDPEPLDLSALDPSRDDARWTRAITEVAARGREQRRFRRAVARRSAVAVSLVAAAAALLWWSAPRRPAPARDVDVLGWAAGASPEQVLNVGGGYAQ